MFETMYGADGCGLAAPQVGESIRVIVVDAGDGGIALIDPEITLAIGEETDVEGCLSIPGAAGYVTRAAEVVVRGLDENGKRIEVRGEGLLARAFQHEIDHLDGVLFIDKATGLRRRESEEQS
jgi:peptide deformylase